jgi:hypothetical protein
LRYASPSTPLAHIEMSSVESHPGRCNHFEAMPIQRKDVGRVDAERLILALSIPPRSHAMSEPMGPPLRHLSASLVFTPRLPYNHFAPEFLCAGNMSTLTISCQLVFCGILALWVARRFRVARKSYPPGTNTLCPCQSTLNYSTGPSGFPLIGNLLQIPRSKPWIHYAQWAQCFGTTELYLYCVSQSSGRGYIPLQCAGATIRRSQFHDGCSRSFRTAVCHI